MQTITNKYALFQSSCYKRISTDTPADNDSYRKYAVEEIERLDGLRFRQQHGYGPYVLDFYCPSLRLCIELDGNIHDEEQVRLKDEERTEFLCEQRIHVLRFRNKDVETDVDGVLNRVREYINKCITQGTAVVQTPTPLT